MSTSPAEIGKRADRIAAALKPACICLFLLLTGGPAVVAQEDTPAAFFRADRERMRQLQAPIAARPVVVQRPTHLIRRGAPVRGFARVAPASPQPAPAAPPSEEAAKPAPVEGTPAEAAPPAAPVQTADGLRAAPDAPAPPAVVSAPAKPSDPSFFVLVIGDSLGQQLGQGLTEAFADLPDVSILRKARENTGLVRDDYFDWTKSARDLVGSTAKINIAVMLAGSNDRQPLRDGALTLDIRQPRWREIYGDRVEAIGRIFKEKKIPLVWVGLPMMKNDRFSADMAVLNEIYQERAGKTGATFVDTWEAFLDDRGQFAAYGPDVNGLFQKLRAGDGVHFTKPGARKLAHFVESEVRHAIEDSRPKDDPLAVAAPVIAPAPQTAPALAAPRAAPSPGPLVALPAPEAPPQVIIPVKPPFGPVSPLTGPVLSAGGTLASARASGGAGLNEARAVLERALTQGQPIEARPGRADDFKWPRN